MYSVMIVDDEKSIRDGFKWFIDKQEDFCIGAEFDDGDKAIEFLKTYKVDVIISDIRMNRISGLEILKYVRKHDIRSKVVIVSGYKEFEYVQTAIKYDADYYLTKPTRLHELKEMFAKLKAELDSEYGELEEAEAEKEIHDLFVFEFLCNTLLGTISKESFEKKLRLLSKYYPLDTSRYALVSGEIRDYETYMHSKPEHASDDFITAMNNIMAKTIDTDDIWFFLISFEKNSFIYIVFSDRYSNEAKFLCAVSDMSDGLKNTLGDMFGLESRVVVERNFNSAEEMYNFKNVNIKSSLFGNSEDRDALIKQAKKYISAHISEEISLEDVARHVHMNPAYFSRYFKLRAGEKFSAYLVKLRVDTAAELLREGEIKISEIGEKVGYPNRSYFSKIFKQQMGCTPKEYLNNLIL
ncbi:MAG: response regulator [Monoglobaceae bacterium]